MSIFSRKKNKVNHYNNHNTDESVFFLKGDKIVGVVSPTLSDEIQKTLDIKLQAGSRVVPQNLILRIIYRFLRSVFPRKSFVVSWAMNWPCKWIVITDEGVFKNFPNRACAIRFEIQYLTHKVKGQVCHDAGDSQY